MSRVTSKMLDDIVKRLRKGESVKCPLCEKGVLEPIGNYKTTYAFKCSECGERLLMEPMLKKE